MKQLRKWGFVVKNRCREPIDEIDSSLECMGPKDKRKIYVMEKGKTGFNDMAMPAFSHAVLLRGMRRCCIVGNTILLKKRNQAKILSAIFSKERY